MKTSKFLWRSGLLLAVLALIRLGIHGWVYAQGPYVDQTNHPGLRHATLLFVLEFPTLLFLFVYLHLVKFVLLQLGRYNPWTFGGAVLLFFAAVVAFFHLRDVTYLIYHFQDVQWGMPTGDFRGISFILFGSIFSIYMYLFSTDSHTTT